MNYFDDEKKQKELLKILKSWEGTPYRHKTGVKGKGVDCIHLTGYIMVEAGVIPKFTVPDYASDWHLHRTSELLIDGISQFPNVEKFDPKTTTLMNGDILIYKYGRASSHTAVYFDGYIWQAIGGDEVRKNSINNIKDRLTVGFRVKKI